MNYIVSFLCLIFLVSNVSSVTFEEDVTLTDHQKNLLDKFKQRVEARLPQDYMKKEIYLIKWLRTNRFDVDVAEANILKDLKWREENKMDTIIFEDFSDMKQFGFRYSLDGRDKLGRSFMYLDIGAMDLRKAILQGKAERTLRFVDKGIEDGCVLIRNLGEKYGNMTRGHLLLNLNNYNQQQHGCFRCIPVLLRILFSYLEHWPECVDKVIGVNAPTTVLQLVTIARPFLDKTLSESIFIYGPNKKQWIKELTKDIDLENLPPELGGYKIYTYGEGQDDYLD